MLNPNCCQYFFHSGYIAGMECLSDSGICWNVNTDTNCLYAVRFFLLFKYIFNHSIISGKVIWINFFSYILLIPLGIFNNKIINVITKYVLHFFCSFLYHSVIYLSHSFPPWNECTIICAFNEKQALLYSK